MTEYTNKISTVIHPLPEDIKERTIHRYDAHSYSSGFKGPTSDDLAELKRKLDQELWDHLRNRMMNGVTIPTDMQNSLLDLVGSELFMKLMWTTETDLSVSFLYKLMSHNPENKNWLRIACHSLSEEIIRKYFAAASLARKGSFATSTISVLLENSIDIDEPFFRHVINNAAPDETNARTIEDMVQENQKFSTGSVRDLIWKKRHGDQGHFKSVMNALTKPAAENSMLIPQMPDDARKAILQACPDTLGNLASCGYLPSKHEFLDILTRGNMESGTLEQVKKSYPNFQIVLKHVNEHPLPEIFDFNREHFISRISSNISAFTQSMPYIICDNPMHLMTSVAQSAKKRGNEIDKRAQGRMWHLANAIGVKPHPIYDYVFFGRMAGPAEGKETRPKQACEYIVTGKATFLRECAPFMNLAECARAGFFPTDLIALDAFVQDVGTIAKLARTGWGSLNIKKMIGFIVNRKEKGAKSNFKPMTEDEKEAMRNGLLYAFISAQGAYRRENGGKDPVAAAIKQEADRIQAEETERIKARQAKLEEFQRRTERERIEAEKAQEEEKKRLKQKGNSGLYGLGGPTLADLLKEKYPDLLNHQQ